MAIISWHRFKNHQIKIVAHEREREREREREKKSYVRKEIKNGFYLMCW